MSGVKPRDAEAIHQVLARYGHVVDGRRWTELDSVFAADAEFHVVNTDATIRTAFVTPWISRPRASTP